MSVDFLSKKWRRCLRVSTTLSFLLLTIALLMVNRSPVTGYEYSLYQSTPAVFWVAIIFCLLNGMLLFHSYYGRSRTWALGLFEILLAQFVFLTLYLYRGFIYIDRFDSQSYVGMAKDVVIFGHFDPSNFYPAISLSMAATGEVIGQSMVLLSQLWPAIFLVAYTVGLLCWSRSISGERRFVVATMLASVPMMFAWFTTTIFHETLMALMLPFFLFLLWRGRTSGIRFKVLAGMMIVLFTVGHLLVAIGALVSLLIIFATESLMKERTPRTVSFLFILFSLGVLGVWIYNNASIVNGLRAVTEQLLGMIEGQSTIGTAQAVASKTGIWFFLKSVLTCTIDDAIFILLALWTGYIILRGGWRTHPLTPVLACLIGGELFIAVIMVFTFAHNPTRMINLNFIMVFSIPLVGYLLCRKRRDARTVKSWLITGLLLFCIVATVFTAYQDPLMNTPNSGVTKSEYNGMGWFFFSRGSTSYLMQTNPWRYAEVSYGSYYARYHPDISTNIAPTTDHFASFLEANDTWGMSYLIFSKYDIVAYTVVWSGLDRFDDHDLNMLAASSSADAVYVNGDVSIYAHT